LTTILFYGVDAETYAGYARSRFPDARLLVARDSDELFAQIGDADVLVGPPFPLKALERAHRLRWYQCTNAGVDFLLPKRDALANVVITNARGIHRDVMADYAMTVVGMLHWGFPALARAQSARAWEQRPVEPLSARTLGVVGLGAVGREIAQRARSAGMTVHGLSRSGASADVAIRHVFPASELHEFLGLVDFVVLVVPATSETQGMIGSAEFGCMKRSAFLINMARGSVVVEKDLIRAIEGRTIAGAVLDVFVQEPLPATSPLWAVENVVITPHMSGYAADYQRRAFDAFATNLEAFLSGESMRNVVDLARGY
jgi:phosphoglycerate dehydrogenase-like enzyme